MEVGEKGICRLSLVPLRNEPSDKAEMVTQLLFGEHYSIIEVSPDEKWVRIEGYADHYQGWIDVKQHKNISQGYFDQINVSDYKISLDPFSTILYKKSPLHIVAGSILPMGNNELFAMEEKLAFNGEAKGMGQKRDFDFLREQGIKYLNTPYLWGGRSPLGIDCSGLVQILYKMTGYMLPRDSGQQAKGGIQVGSLQDVKPGDLAFFNKDGGPINHVGIVIEDNKILHASGKVRIDMLDEGGIKQEESGLYTHQLTQIRRIFNR